MTKRRIKKIALYACFMFVIFIMFVLSGMFVFGNADVLNWNLEAKAMMIVCSIAITIIYAVPMEAINQGK